MATDSLTWPPLPQIEQLPVLALQVSFEQIQWWSFEKIRAHQLLQIQSLIDHAYETVPFYRARLKPFAQQPSGWLSMERFREIELLSRSAALDAAEDLVTRRLPPHQGVMSSVRTSGSTGQPLEVKCTGLTALFYQALGLRYHLWHRRDLSAKSVRIAALPHDVDLKRYQNWASGVQTGPAVRFNHALPASRLLELLLQEDPQYLQVHPSTLWEMILISQATGRKPEKLLEVRTASEILDPELRELCRREWGAPISDMYSCEEVNIMALQCPASLCYHEQSENCLIEVLDDDGLPCAAGQLGKVVVTSLNNYATPMLRYEIGDLAVLGEPCLCGRGLPTIEKIVGRVRNLAVLPGGEKVTPIFSIEPLLNELPIRHFQLVQTSLEEIEASLVVSRALSRDEENRLAEMFNRGFRHEFRFHFRYVDEIRRGANGKFEVFRCDYTE